MTSGGDALRRAKAGGVGLVLRKLPRAVDARHADMIWTHPGVSTYYRNSNGRVVLATPWSLLEYWQMTHAVDLDDYEVV